MGAMLAVAVVSGYYTLPEREFKRTSRKPGNSSSRAVTWAIRRDAANSEMCRPAKERHPNRV
jgi:hypothetical protein